jgi:hypothetical protein
MVLGYFSGRCEVLCLPLQNSHLLIDYCQLQKPFIVDFLFNFRFCHHFIKNLFIYLRNALLCLHLLLLQLLQLRFDCFLQLSLLSFKLNPFIH